MNIISGSINGPRSFIVAGKQYGQMYDSRDRQVHLAFYIPYARPPLYTLCGRYRSSWPGSRDINPHMCPDCWKALLKLEREHCLKELNKCESF